MSRVGFLYKKWECEKIKSAFGFWPMAYNLGGSSVLKLFDSSKI
jgi:hypothetical protein